MLRGFVAFMQMSGPDSFIGTTDIFNDLNTRKQLPFNVPHPLVYTCRNNPSRIFGSLMYTASQAPQPALTCLNQTDAVSKILGTRIIYIAKKCSDWDPNSGYYQTLVVTVPLKMQIDHYLKKANCSVNPHSLSIHTVLVNHIFCP